MVQGSEFRKRERRGLIEWFASKDIEKIEDAEFRRAIRPIQALQQEKEAQKQLSLLVFHSRSLPEPSSTSRIRLRLKAPTWISCRFRIFS